MKYHLITYGCQMNTADSAEMAQPLKDRGMTATADPKEADIILMNTCTVREQAEHRAYSNLGRLREWKAQDPNRILIVAGCAATRWGDSVKKQYPFIDLVSPATRIEEFPETVAQVLKERWNWNGETATAFGMGASEPRRLGDTSKGPFSDAPALQLPGPFQSSDAQMPRVSDAPVPFLFGDDQTAYITIMRGCNYSCAYCIVPQVRGRESYRPLEQIVEEVRAQVARGLSEVMLLGQTVNSYYDRGGEPASRREGEKAVEHSSPGAPPPTRPLAAPSAVRDFADLLRAVDAIDGVRTIRFMSPHPRHMRSRVIAAMAECRKVARHLHLPVQSGSDRVLLAMKRLYTRSDYCAIVERLREAIPDLRVTTDVIVGYPGESEADFQATLDLMSTLRFDGIFAFKYSPRPGTTASAEVDDVPESVKEHRLQVALALNRAVKAA